VKKQQPTSGKTVSSVILTVNDWQTASNAKRRQRYFIYIVTDAPSAEPPLSACLILRSMWMRKN